MGVAFADYNDLMLSAVAQGDLHEPSDEEAEFLLALVDVLPVVFTDLEPFAEHEYPENSGYVGYDTAELGEQAGWWLVNHLRGVRRPRVLIIASREHASRQEECARVLRA